MSYEADFEDLEEPGSAGNEASEGKSVASEMSVEELKQKFAYKKGYIPPKKDEDIVDTILTQAEGQNGFTFTEERARKEYFERNNQLVDKEFPFLGKEFLIIHTLQS